MAHEGIALDVCQLDDPIFASEGPEKLDFEFGVAQIFSDEGIALDIGLLSRHAMAVAAVFEDHKALVRDGRGGRRAMAAALKTHGVGCDFKPFASLAGEVHIWNVGQCL
jgi:hypothetical protein